jgi:uncharacterized membrane-anchored protein
MTHLSGNFVNQVLTNTSKTLPRKCAPVAILGMTAFMLELIFRALIVVVVVLAGVLLFSPYEAVLEGFVALLIVAAVVVGFLMYPRRDVFYVRTTVRLIRPDRNRALEHDFVAVKVELARLWLLFVPTCWRLLFSCFLQPAAPQGLAS